MSDLTHLNKELVLLIIQFLGDEKYKGAMHMLEQESGFFFDLTYFEEKILNGEWDELERYISGFTKYNDNRHSIKIMFEITKQKYLEALDRNLKAEAADILVKELRKFSLYNPEVYKDLTELLTLHNFRENAHLNQYADIRSARERMVVVLTKVVKTNPLLKDKLIFPTAGKSRLRKLINQSLNWQHDQCKNPVPNPVVRTLYEDHYCPPPLIGPLPRPFFGQPLPGPFPAPFPSVEGAIAPYQANGEVASLKRPRTTPATVSEVGPSITGFTAIDRMAEELEHSRYNVEGTSQTSTQLRTSWLAKNLPKNVAYSFHQGSKVTSMEFHPNQHTLLLVGARNGEFSIWELKSQQRVASEPFKIWDTAATSLELQGTLSNEDACISVSRVTWSPDGNYFGVAYTRNLIHLYAHSGINEICQCLEINAHDGRVNDLAFDHRDKELYLITCGDDKVIKVWDIAGQNLYNFVGHEAPVYSVCPHHNKNFQFIFSTSIDGKIRTWMYDNEGPISGCDAPGNWCTTLIFKSDGSSRMFSCGTSKEGDTFLVQWSANNGIVDDEAKRKIYSGFTEKSARIAHFDITNQFLAVGEDSQIKYWHMDHDDVLTSTNVEGGLPSRPRLRFNKEGSLLAVTTANEGFMILANGTGRIRVGLPYSDKLRVPIESIVNKEAGSSLGANVNEDNGKSERSSPARPSTSHVSYCD
uniref:topless-related protein 3 isoform X1 n=1 Tax=Fragaria vesca subsp. vesca TaxID=101020 RepID=UPI0005C99B08|nr:PREDICTED: topless-related protein 3 isoform X1 [Fragaria vesca subsp. vesca]